MLDSLVIEIGDEQIAIGSYGHAAWRIKFTRPGTGMSDRSLMCAIEGKDLDTIIPVIGHIKLVMGNGQIHGAPQLARLLSGGAELTLEVSLKVEHLYPRIAGIGDKYLVFGNGNPCRIIEFSGTDSSFAPSGHEPVPRLLFGSHESRTSKSQKTCGDK